MSLPSSTPSSSGGSVFTPPSVEELDAILSRFEFRDFLGQGGMGAVYKARQPKLDRMVAIKILPTILDEEDDSEAQYAKRFKQEALAMARLNHKHIVPVHDFGATSDGHLYIVMDFIEGTDLHQAIKTGQCSVERAFQWGPQICDALQYAHSEGIVHRDIKPSNILLDTDGDVKVADFGIAKLTGDHELTRLTKTDVTMGSPDYLAPELLQDGVEPDSRADLFSVGVMLYQMLTGSVPRGAWQPPSVINPEADERFDDLVVRAMDPNPETRFQEAIEIADAILEIEADYAASGPRKGGPVVRPVRPVQAAPGSGPRSKSGSTTTRRPTGSTHTAPLPPPALKPDGAIRPVAPVKSSPSPADPSEREHRHRPVVAGIAAAVLGAIGMILYALCY